MGKEVKPTFRLTIQAQPGASPPVNRLRAALKCLLRSFGMKCIEVQELPASSPSVKADPHGDQDEAD